MSFLDSFFEGASGSAAQYFQKETDALRTAEMDKEKSAREEERAIRMAKLQEELAVQKEQSVLAVRRAMNIQAGQDISSEADKIGTKRVLDKTNPVEDQSTWTPAQEAVRSKTQPGLLSSLTRTEQLNNRSDAAMNLGYEDKAKSIKDQQNIEANRELDIKKGERMEAQTAAQVEANRIREKRGEASAEAEAIRAEAALKTAIAAETRAAKADGDGSISGEERKRYTALMGDSSRNLKDARAALSTLMKSYDATPEDIKTAKDNIKTYEDEHKIYTKLLAGSADKKAEPSSDAPKTYGGYPVQTTKTQEEAKSNKASPDSRKQGQVEILRQEVSKAQAIASDPKSKPEEIRRANQDLEALGRELKNLGESSSRLDQFKVLGRKG